MPTNKNPHLQILRALAASVVVVDHAFNSLAYLGEPRLLYDGAAQLLGVLGVSAFFVLSGFLMFRQSSEQFAVPGKALVFTVRRFLRVVPMYWIAVSVFVGVCRYYWHSPIPNLLRQYALALAFLPNPYSKPLLQPVLAHGWTLNFEVFFYAIFALCLLLPRKRGLTVLCAALILPFLAGTSLPLVTHGGLGTAIAWFYTREQLLLFLAGVLLAVLERDIARFTPRRFPGSPAYLLLVPAAVLMLDPRRYGHAFDADAFYLMSTLVVLFCIFGKPYTGGRMERLSVMLGDASYSTYLFHPWSYLVIFSELKHVYPHRPIPTGVFLVLSLFAAHALGVLIHFVLERPLTRALQSLAFPGNKQLHAAVEQPSLGV